MSGFIRTIARTKVRRTRKAHAAHFFGRGSQLGRDPSEKPTRVKSLKRGTGGINPCYRSSVEASKADLAEYHAEEMALRRAHQRHREPNGSGLRSTSIATGNRHGGAHQHRREIARRAKP